MLLLSKSYANRWSYLCLGYLDTSNANQQSYIPVFSMVSLHHNSYWQEAELADPAAVLELDAVGNMVLY